MGQAAFHAVIGLLALQDLELRLQVSACSACGSPEQGNEFSGNRQIGGTVREALWDHFLALVALDQQVGW
jgi:hypothetical protein